MKARSFSHVGITVSNFNRFVQYYSDVFGCRLVGVADHPAERVRTFFGIEGAVSLKVGWVLVPGGGILEIFEFTPQQPPAPINCESPRLNWPSGPACWSKSFSAIPPQAPWHCRSALDGLELTVPEPLSAMVGFVR